MKNYHADSISQVFDKLQSAELGLSSVEAKQRLQTFGLNNLPSSKTKMTKAKIFMNQWKSPLILILAVAGIISGILAEYTDMIVILITVFVNVIIGFVQEYKADVALEKLQDFVKYNCLVFRDAKKVLVSSTDLVPGDVMLLDVGAKIQADARIIKCNNLQINEAVLTGESALVTKDNKKISKETGLASRTNMVYRGTTIANGNAMVVITDVGKNTEMGKIAILVKETSQESTPLQNQLQKMSKVIGIVVLLIAIFIFVLGILQNSVEYSLLQMFETAVAVAVAAIPEGLVISVTVILAIGMQHILKRKALVRKLISAETLGSVSVICTDKTGTLTEGKMRLVNVITSNNELDNQEINLLNLEDKKFQDVKMLLQVGVLCNDSFLENGKAEEKDWNFVGDTTDSAFLFSAKKIGIDKQILENKLKRIDEIPFDSKNKFMLTLNEGIKENNLYLKGSFESVFVKVNFYRENGKIKKLDKKTKEWFIKQESILTEKGLRVLALANKKIDKNIKTIEKQGLDDFVFLGIVALSDPLRLEAKETILRAKQAGIRTIMITGDNPKTAQFIGRELGIECENKNILTGLELEAMTDTELSDRIDNLFIFARVDPKHKIRIVEVLQRKGEVVAMTGDGVNDAPALKGANIGIALGSGTDISKDIAGLVLTDDDFSTIVAAVEEGRHIYKNIRKVILYLLSGSFTEIVLIGGSILFGLPLALLPVQILWVNLIEDSFPNMALAFDKKAEDNMKEKPRAKTGSIIDREMIIMIVTIAVVSNMVLFFLFWYYLSIGTSIGVARTIMFVALGIDSLFYIYSIRSMKKHVWQMSLFDNKYLTGAVLLGWFLLVSAVYFPPLQLLLKTSTLGFGHWVVIILFGLLNIFIIEIIKGIFLVRNKFLNHA